MTLIAAVAAQSGLTYPVTRTVDHVDVYHGTKVPDPYRWLEDDTSPETKAWVEAQNKVTFAYLDKIPYRAQLTERLKRLYDYEKYSAPARKGDDFFFRKNDGLQNQSVLYIQKGIDGKPEVLIDPNTWSKDGTTILTVFAPSKDARLAVYGVSQGGSDWQQYNVLDLSTRQPLTDKIEWVKVSSAAWRGSGFYYSRYPQPEKGKELSSANEDHQVFYHRVGTPQSEDELVYSDPKNPQRFHTVSTTEDERFLILNISDRGTGKQGNAIMVRDLSKPGATFTPLIPDITDDSYNVLENIRGELLVYTDNNAPNGRVVRINPANPAPSNWVDIIAPKTEPIDGVGVAGGKIFVTYMKDVASKAYVHNLEGALENEIGLPGLGSVSGFGGNLDDKFVFYNYTSFTYPTTIFRYDISSRRSSTFRAPEVPGLDPSVFETKQVFVTSKDGTKVPMFIVRKKGSTGPAPTLLYAYGGFNASITPAYSPTRLAWLEAGGTYVLANIRGGGEYGKAWHDGGRLANKQNVFDDFIAAGEYLKAQGITGPNQLAIEGGSNGGLLVGAVLNQRPDLFAAAHPAVGVMDMLRFDRFTAGRYWVDDYGYPNKEGDFRSLLAYSPYHNIKGGRDYPAILVTTADTDDRVVPGHSFKYIAALQAAENSGTAPHLIRIETRAGHGSGKPTSKIIEETADVFAFLGHFTGLDPK